MLILKGLILLAIINVICVIANELKIAFWIDPIQKDIYGDIKNALKEIENLHLDVNIHDYVLVVENDEEKTAENFNKFCEILSTEGVSVVLDFTYHIWEEGLEFLAKQNVPYLRVDRLLAPFLQIFAEFLLQKGGNDVVLIFQNEQDKHEALLQIVDGYRFRTILLNAADDNEFVQRIQRLRPSPSYYAIFARGTNMNNIFEKVIKGNIFLRPTEWHFVFLDPRDRVFKYKKQVEFANKFTMNAKNLCRSMRMKDTYCLSGFTIQRGLLLEIFRSLSYLKQYNMDWLNPMYIDCNETEVTNPYRLDLLTHLDLQYFLTFSSVPVVNNEILEEFLPPMLTYNINVSINFYSSEHEAVTDLALWQNGELRRINETITPAKRFFRIGMTEAIPWNYYRRDPHTDKIVLDRNGNPIWEGYCIDFVSTLAVKLNFVYEIVEPSRGKFGKRDPKTGEWDGIVGDLVTGEIDFAVTALKMYSEREEVIDYIAPYFEQTGISIVMRKPVRQTSLFKFMTVLRLEVWLSIIAALNATAVMIWLMDKYSPYSARNNKEAYPYPCREFTLRESFWFALTSFTPQGGGEAPKAVSGRILVAAYWLFVVLMLATFTANLAAFLTVERMQTPVQSLEQLARQSRINYTVVAESDTHQYFINMKFAEDTLYRMWKELSLNASEDYHKFRIWDYPIKEQYGHILLAINGSNPVENAVEGFRKVNEYENADFAFIHDSSEIKYEITRNCNLTEVGEVFAEQPYAVAVQQGSHLTDEFSFTILELQKDRYFEELKAKYWNYSLLKECALADGQGGITLESLGGVFIATLFGLGLAMVTLGIELFYYKRKHINSAIKRDVIKVKPADEDIVSAAWNENKESNKITPPPLFEQLTFRGKTIPPNITLGDSFRPRQISMKIRRKFSGEETNEDSKLPPYVE